jgi:predicted Fe-Mo cluster-binding NifX family protein
MRVAIPIWDGRISPVLDAAKRLLVVDVDDGKQVARDEVAIDEAALVARARRLVALGVDVLICGAVSWPLERMLVSAGVKVIGQTCGMVEDVLAAYVSGGLTEGAFLMPGCCGRRRRFQGGRRRGGPGFGMRAAAP